MLRSRSGLVSSMTLLPMVFFPSPIFPLHLSFSLFIFPPSPTFHWALRHIQGTVFLPKSKSYTLEYVNQICSWLQNAWQGFTALNPASNNREEVLLEKEGPLLWCQPGSHISVKSLLTYTHTSTGFMGVFKRLFRQTDIKGGWAQSREAKGKKKKNRASPTLLLFSSLVLSLSSPHHPEGYPLPLAPPVLCCAGWIPGSC